MAEIDYRTVLYSLVNDGFVDIETIRAAVKKVEQAEVKEARNTQAWQDARLLLTELNDRIKANGRRPSRVNETAVSVIERLIRLDGKTTEEIRGIIDWCQGHDFWHTVILSPEKLRKHFDTMVAQRERDAGKKPKETIFPISTFDESEYDKVRAESVAKPTHIDLRSALRGMK